MSKNERSVEFIVRVPKELSDSDLAGAVEDFFRRTVEGLGGELVETNVEELEEEEEEEDGDEVESPDEARRVVVAQARNEFIRRLRDPKQMGWVLSPYEQTALIKAYDLDHQLPAGVG